QIKGDEYNSYKGKMFTVEPNGLKATIAIDWRIADYDTFKLLLNTAASEPEPEPEPVPNYLLPENILTKFTADKVTVKVGGVLATVNMVINVGDKLELSL